MKKLFLLIAAVAFFAPASLFAQNADEDYSVTEDEFSKTIVEKTKTDKGYVITTTVIDKKAVFTNGFWKNWQLSAGIGTQAYLGDNDYKVEKVVPEMLAFPAVDLYLTKWASPSFGVGLGANWSKFKGLYQGREYWQNQPVKTTANFRPDKEEPYNRADGKWNDNHLMVQKGSYLNVFALAHANLMNMFGGYKPNRFYEIDAYAGGAFDGEGYVLEPTKQHWLKNIKSDGMLGATVGLTWNIGKEASKWRMAERTSVYQYDKDLVEIIKHDTTYVKEPVPDPIIPEVWFHINFIVDRWDISKKELINIHAVADLIKSTPDVKYLVCGYADKQTATPPHNLMLSENRAKAVYNALVNEFGVDPDQLVMDYKGGVDYMFYNMKELSRCVMITSIKEQ